MTESSGTDFVLSTASFKEKNFEPQLSTNNRPSSRRVSDWTIQLHSSSLRPVSDLWPLVWSPAGESETPSLWKPQSRSRLAGFVKNAHFKRGLKRESRGSRRRTLARWGTRWDSPAINSTLEDNSCLVILAAGLHRPRHRQTLLRLRVA